MASRALVNASSKVSPAEKQPGKSGTTTPYACLASPVSIAMGYRIDCKPHLRPACFRIARTKPFPRSFFGCGTVNGARLGRMHELVVAAASSLKLPTIRLQELDQLTTLHRVYYTHWGT